MLGKEKRLYLAAFGALVLALLSGCASSDRMLRMSGGVLGKYSAPESFRLQSQQYRKQSSTRYVDTPKIAGMNDTLVNIWPFFFRNNDYCSALWPIYDRDQYGFAVRPFYNQEGDDRSVLFPLSAWNAEKGKGWVLNYAWSKDSFGFIPLSWQHQDRNVFWCYYFPFLVLRRNYDKSGRVIKGFTLTGPAYYGVSNKGQNKCYGLFPLFHWRNKNDRDYRFTTLGGLAYYRTVPEDSVRTAGLFPLFHLDKDGANFNFAALCWLSAIKRNSSFNVFSWHVFGPLLARYKSVGKYPNSKSESYEEYSKFTGLLWLLKKHKASHHYVLRQETKDELQRLSRNFPSNREQFLDSLYKIDSELNLPDDIKDSQSCLKFVDDLKTGVSRTYSGYVFPFYTYSGNVENRSFKWQIPLFLSWYSRRGDNLSFTSIPIATHIASSDTRKRSYVLTPLVYSSKAKNMPAQYHKIVPESTSWPSGESKVCDIKTRLFTFAYHHDKDGYSVAKEHAEEVEHIRNELNILIQAGLNLEHSRQKLKSDQERIDSMEEDSRLKYFRKMVAVEELKIDKENFEKSKNKFDAQVQSVLEKASAIGFELDKDAFVDKDKNAEALERLLAKYTELQYLESWGNSLFFKREKSYTGDYRWSLLLGLAAGNKDGGKENSHVFHLLYSYRKDGAKSEKIFFPFCTDVKDGENSRFTFMGRVFQKTVRNGRHSGYFMFMPYGDK